MINPVNPAKTFAYAGARMNIYHVAEGEGLPLHVHTYNHGLICPNGECVVRLKNKEIILNKDSTPVNLPAGVPHEIEALKNETVFITIFEDGKF